MSKQDQHRRSPLTVLLVVLLVLVIGVLSWGGWVYGIRYLIAKSATAKSLQEAVQAVATKPADGVEVEAALPLPEQGKAIWILEIPSLHVRLPVIAGVDDDSLSKGVGWYSTTNLPGEAGNVAIAGHRTREARPFLDLLMLRRGDEVRLVTSLATYTYQIRIAPAELTVHSSQSWVLDPVPGQDFDPHESILTLTTDQDLFPTADRSVGFAVLTTKEPR